MQDFWPYTCLEFVQEHLLQDVVDQLVDRRVAVLGSADPNRLLRLLENRLQHHHLLHRRGLIPVDVGVHRLNDLVPGRLLPLNRCLENHPHEHDIHLGLRVVPHELLDFLKGVHVPLVDVLKRDHCVDSCLVHDEVVNAEATRVAWQFHRVKSKDLDQKNSF